MPPSKLATKGWSGIQQTQEEGHLSRQWKLEGQLPGETLGSLQAEQGQGRSPRQGAMQEGNAVTIEEWTSKPVKQNAWVPSPNPAPQKLWDSTGSREMSRVCPPTSLPTAELLVCFGGQRTERTLLFHFGFSEAGISLTNSKSTRKVYWKSAWPNRCATASVLLGTGGDTGWRKEVSL